MPDLSNPLGILKFTAGMALALILAALIRSFF